jgi:hypothetical protein
VGGISTFYDPSTKVHQNAPGGIGGGVDPFFMEMARRKIGLDEQKKKLEIDALRRATTPQDRPVSPRVNPNAGRRRMYTKQLTGQIGASSGGGTVAAQPWEPGAAFSGYAPEGSMGTDVPNNASQQGTFGPGAAPSSESPDFGFGPNTKNIPGSEGSYLGMGEKADADPFPHGTGGVFEQERMRNALARSNREYDERMAGQRKSLRG